MLIHVMSSDRGSADHSGAAWARAERRLHVSLGLRFPRMKRPIDWETVGAAVAVLIIVAIFVLLIASSGGRD